MADVEKVLREYIREHRAGGEADPREYLTRVGDRGDRLELEALIDAYLENAPRVEVDASVGSAPAEAVVDRVLGELGAPAQTWRVVLPSLRMQAKLKRDELVQRLAVALGVAGYEPKVARYYNAMEHEQLDPAGVSERVFAALASIVNTSADTLRRAAPRRPDDTVADMAFARSAPWELDPGAVAGAAPAPAGSVLRQSVSEWDEVDELFRGG
jgi:hypothetical protein